MFQQLPLHERLLRAVEQLGYQAPTPVQAEAIPAALNGRDLRVTAQTGSGKTAAFLLPLLDRLVRHPDHRKGARVLILAPTRELARQIAKSVEQLTPFTFVSAEAIIGGEDFKVQAARMRRNPDILIGTPGRLLEHLESGTLELGDVEALVLDEADRMLDMGFKDDVLRLAQACPDSRQTLLFSATPGGDGLAQVVAAVLRDPQELVINSVRDMQTSIRQQIITVDDLGHKERVLRWLLANEPYDKVIVFTNTREQADRLAGVLRSQFEKIYVLHGEKDHKERKQIMDRFRNGDLRVLVATDVAARGIDIDGLDLVINFDMPRSGDDYLHRVGRTGRQGRDGVAISLVAAHEWNLMASIQRYLRQQFEARVIEAFPGKFQGPKKLKASGKAAGSKKKKLKKKDAAKSAAKGSGKAPAKTAAKAPAKPGARSSTPRPAAAAEGAAAKPAARPRRPAAEAGNDAPRRSADSAAPKRDKPAGNRPRRPAAADTQSGYALPKKKKNPPPLD